MNVFDPRLIESIEKRLPEEKRRRESIEQRDIQRRKWAQMRKVTVGAQREGNICVLTRWNGHKADMQNKPGQWQMLQQKHESCWICQKHIYALVFFNPSKRQRAMPDFLVD